jgi:hypothetical protein
VKTVTVKFLRARGHPSPLPLPAYQSELAAGMDLLADLEAELTLRPLERAAVPTGLANGDVAAVTLTATAREDDNGAALGSALTEATANTAGVDTVFADAAGVADGLRDAAFSATDDYIVVTATISAATRENHATPTEICRPVKMKGSAPGITMWRKICHLLAPRQAAARG